ncbi:MAG TPA: DUF4870 domain-containing protein [Abditibacteriaceae bacterium]|jgi:uncharacterized Tic20 family protein
MQNPGTSVQPGPSQGECLMAAGAHLAVLLPHVGIVVPLILWLVNKDIAPFAAYQAKQAFWFQLLTIVGFWVLIAVALTLGLVTFGLGLLAALPLLLVWHVAADVYGIIGAVYSAQARDFRYILVGSMVQPD